MGLVKGQTDERGISEIYGTVLIFALVFVTAVALVGVGLFVLNDTTTNANDRLAQDSMLELDDRLKGLSDDTDNSITWEVPQGTGGDFEADSDAGTINITVKTNKRYWDAGPGGGALVDASGSRVNSTEIALGTITHTANDGTLTVYQGGGVLEIQGGSTSILREPNIDVTNNSLGLSLFDISSIDSIGNGQKFTLSKRADPTDTSSVQEMINDAMQNDGEIVAPAQINMTITTEYADGWAAFAEKSGGATVHSTGPDTVKIGFGEFGSGVDIPPNASEPYGEDADGDDVIYSGVSELAPELHDPNNGTISEVGGDGFKVDSPADYTVGVHVPTAETDGNGEWWAWNGSLGASGKWENVERSNKDIAPRTSGFPTVNPTNDEFKIAEGTPVCVIEGDGIKSAVTDAGNGCLTHSVGGNESALEADLQPYLEVSQIDATPAYDAGVLELTDTVDIELDVQNTGPGKATDEPVGAFLADSTLGEFVRAGTTISSLDSGATAPGVIDTTVAPGFLLTEQSGNSTTFAVGGATAFARNTTNPNKWSISNSTATGDVVIDSLTLDESSITAGETISGEVEFNNTATSGSPTSVSALVSGGPNSQGVRAVDLEADPTKTTTVEFNLSTNRGSYNFSSVTAEIPGVDSSTEPITVKEPDTTPEFVINGIDYKTATNVSAGNQIKLNATIENVGTVSDVQPVQYATVDPATGDRTATVGVEGAVELDPGESTEVTLKWNTTVRDVGTYKTAVFTAQDNSSVEDIEVTPGTGGDADFEVRITGAEDTVASGPLNVTAEIENVGSESGTRVVWLTSEDDDAAYDDTSVSLTPGATTTETLRWNTDRDDNGTRTVVVATLDDSDKEDVEVINPDSDANLTLADITLDSSDTITAGQQANVSVTVENPASESIGGTGTVLLEDIFGNTTAIAETPFLNPGESATVDDLSWQTLPGDAGNGTLTAELDGQRRDVPLTVEPREEDRTAADVVFVHDESGSMIWRSTVESNVERVASEDFFTSSAPVVVPGEGDVSLDNQVWEASGGGTTEYFYSNEQLSNPGTYDDVTVYDIESGATGTLSAGDTVPANRIGYGYNCGFSCSYDGEVYLPGDTVDNSGNAQLYELTERTTATGLDGIDTYPNQNADYYTQSGTTLTYTSIRDIEQSSNGIDSILGVLAGGNVADLESNFTSWVTGTGSEVQDYGTVPPGQAWSPSDTSRYVDIALPGEPVPDDEVEVFELGEDPFGQRVDATEAFLDELDEDQDRVGYVQFDTSATRQQDITDNFADLSAALNTDAGGGTDISAGIDEGIDMLDDSDNERVMILLGDGLDNQGGDPIDAAEDAADENITIYTIGLGRQLQEIPDGKDQLQNIANETGGEFFFAENADELIEEFSSAADEVTAPDGPKFAVNISDDTLPDAERGGSVSVDVTVENVGSQSGSRPVWLVEEFSGQPVASVSPTIDNGSSETVTLTWDDIELSSDEFDGSSPPTADGNLTVRTATESDEAGLTVVDRPSNFAITDATLANPGTEPFGSSETIEIETTITNTKSGTDTQEVELQAPWGAPVDGETVSLSGSGSVTRTLRWDLSTVELSRDNVTLTVTTEDDTETVANIDLEETASSIPTYRVDTLASNANETANKSIEAGEDLEVEATITNTGDTTAEQFVQLQNFDGKVVSVKPVEIPDGTTQTVNFTWETTVFDSGVGDVTVTPTVGTGASSPVNITTYDPAANFNLNIVNTNADAGSESIAAGQETLEVVVKVEHTGDEDRAIVELDDVDDPTRIPTLRDFGRLDDETITKTLRYKTEPEDYEIDEIEVDLERYNVSETAAVNITQSNLGSNPTITNIDTNADSRADAATAGKDPVNVTVTFAEALSGDNAVSLYEGTGVTSGYLRDFNTTAGTTTVELQWQPQVGDGDTLTARSVTVSVKSTAVTVDVYVDPAPDDTVTLPDGPDEPVGIDVDEIQAS